MGLFAEVFYSPYDDEVLELYIAANDELVSDFSKLDPSECDDEEDTEKYGTAKSDGVTPPINATYKLCNAEGGVALGAVFWATF